MKYYSIGKFAELVGKSVQTIRNWDKNDSLKPAHRSKGGHRYYSLQQVNQVLGIKRKTLPKRTFGYCRVSSKKQEDDLQRQIKYVKDYMIARGYQFEVISDIGSGINYKNKGLNELIDLVINGRVEKIVLLYKDRLVRFGFELIESLCERFGVDIEVIDNTPKTDEQELVEDLIQIVTVFSARLQGKRAHKAKKIIEELEKDD